MQKLILVRNGEHENNVLSGAGREALIETAERIAAHLIDGSCVLIAAGTPRVLTSAELLAGQLSLDIPFVRSELYAEPEQGVDPSFAYARILEDGVSYDTVIAVVSRAYAETLPSYIQTHVFHAELQNAKSLARGEALVIDFEKQKVY